MANVLASPTNDLAAARADIDEHGYCLVEGALSPEEVATLRSRLEELAAAEVADGTDYVYEGGANQRVWTLLNKGDLFVDLALHPIAFQLIDHLLGAGFLLSNIDCNIAGPGGPPMFLHADQSFLPPPWPNYAQVANIMWMLDDFKPENGATCIVPGSHRLDYGPGFGPAPAEPTPVVAPAGTAMVFDGRLWHQTGANTTTDERRFGILSYYCRPYLRMQENWFLSLDRSVLERYSPKLHNLLGWGVNYLSLGMVDGMPRKGPRW